MWMGVESFVRLFPGGKKNSRKERLHKLYKDAYNLYMMDAYRILGAIEEAQDVVQSVFLRIQEDPRLFYRVTELEYVPAIQYVRRMILSESRAYKAMREEQGEIASGEDGYGDLIWSIIEGFPTEERMILSAYFRYPDLSFQSLADLCGIRQDEIKKGFEKAKKHMQAELKRYKIRIKWRL